MRCFRIRFRDLVIVECDGKLYRKSEVEFPDAVRVARLFKKHGNLELIRDGRFLIGSVCDGKIRGKRVDVLPDGKKLSKGYSLFAKDLVVHDERSSGHWDVLFRNPSGSFSYLYTLDKIRISKEKKFKIVDDFESCLPRLKRNLLRALGEDDLVLAMLVLLKTKIRVGGEIYYKRNRHKGLTTLKKKDLDIKGDYVVFSFIGKDGVPQVLKKKFSKRVVAELKKVLRKRKRDDFVFLNGGKRVFRDSDFEAGFERFCGERFYPHIVRSHFATREVEGFLRRSVRGKKRISEDAKKFCLKLAGELGHKKFSKKKGEWENSYEVTLHHYVRPDLVEKIRKLL